MNTITIGNTTFSVKSLKSCETLKEAQERFKRHDKDVIKRAYDKAKKVKS